MTDIIIMIVTTIGTLFIFLAALGVVRMPDFYLRLSVTTKAITLGLGLILIGAAFFFGNIAVTSRVVAIIFFLILTAPVAAHMIGRASYFTGIKLWEGSVIDELKGMYNKETHELKSGTEESEKEKEKQKEKIREREGEGEREREGEREGEGEREREER